VPAHSHPSSAAGALGWLQFTRPAPHVESHTPLVEHESVATLALLHARPQPPQLLVVARFVSQPSSAAGAAGVVQLP
jgi:hypothetical protein